MRSSDLVDVQNGSTFGCSSLRGAEFTGREGCVSDTGVVDVDVEVRAVLPFPREVVAAYAGDPSNAPDWYANIDSVRWRTQPPVAVGSRMDFEARFLGRRLPDAYEVVALASGERLVMRTSGGPFPMETTYTWSDAAGGGRSRDAGVSPSSPCTPTSSRVSER